MWPLFLLVSPAVLLPLASATNYDASGTFTLNTTSSSSGCLVLAQLTPPSTLQSLLPICPAGTPYASALGGTAVPWPLNANGSGTASDLLLFGAVGSDGGEEAPYFARPGCALDLGPEEVQYVLDRTLGFDAASGEVYDYSAEGYIMNGTSGGPLVCSPYLAAGDWLPDPYSYAATDTVWSTPITVSLASSASSAGATSSSSSHSVAASASTSAVELVGGTSSATAPPTCAASTVTVSASAAVSTVTTTVSELATASRASVAAEALTVTVTVTATAAASATASGDECSAVTITEHVTVTAT